MPQISMFEMNSIPETYEEIDQLLECVREGETDSDLFSYNETSTGRSYSFYGTKVFEFVPKKGKTGKSKLKVCTEIKSALEHTELSGNKITFSTISLTTDDDVRLLIEALKTRKHYIFRHLITDTFGCCNDFMRCSDAERCIHQTDRFYNGCIYRTNMEQGKIFYGSKRNID